MTLLAPGALILLLAVPILALFYVLAQRRRRRYALRYSNLSSVREAMGNATRRRHIPAVLFLVAATLMLFALARPEATFVLPAEQGVVILAIDDSGSMAADDLKPTRLEAAKAAAKAFVDEQGPDVAIGVVGFSSSAQIVQSPTSDHDAVLSAINRLTPQTATAVGRGILTSLDAIFADSETTPPSEDALAKLAQGPAPAPGPLQPTLNYPVSIVLLTDGQNDVMPSPLDVLFAATTRGVRIYTVGMGTVEGTVLHINGQTRHESLDEQTLSQISESTKGQYFSASTTAQLISIFKALHPGLTLKPQHTEVTAVFTALAALFAIVAISLSVLFFSGLL